LKIKISGPFGLSGPSGLSGRRHFKKCACRLAGADVVDIVNLSELLYGEKRLDDYHFLNLPGGFLDGNDLGSAKAGAHRIMHARVAGTGEPLYEQFSRFIRDGKLIFGVCNGFQLMVKLGILPGLKGEYFKQTATLTFNDSGRFEDRWVYLKINDQTPCIYTRGLRGVYLPVPEVHRQERHGSEAASPEEPRGRSVLQTRLQ